MKQTFSLAAVAILVTLGLAACGGGGGSTSASGIEPATERLEHTEEGCAFAEKKVKSGDSDYQTVLAECRGQEVKLRQMVEAGNGGSTDPLPNGDKTDEAATGAVVREIEERCEFDARELRANGPAGWKVTLEGCKDELKDAEEPSRVAREEEQNERRLEKSRRSYREEKEGAVKVRLRRLKEEVRSSKKDEMQALKELCSASISEVVAEEKRTGHYLREYWRECR